MTAAESGRSQGLGRAGSWAWPGSCQRDGGPDRQQLPLSPRALWRAPGRSTALLSTAQGGVPVSHQVPQGQGHP